MIIRAMFSVGLLSVLAPHEPSIIASGIDGASIESPSIAKENDGAGIGGANSTNPQVTSNYSQTGAIKFWEAFLVSELSLKRI